MSYADSYLRLLDASGGINGWPDGVDQEGIDFAMAKAKEYLDKWGKGSLIDIRVHIYQERHLVPKSIESSLQDFTLAVAYRACLAIKSKKVFVLEEGTVGKKDDEHWMMIKVSRHDVENLKSVSKLFTGAAVKASFAKIIKQLAISPLFNLKQREEILK